MTFKDRWRNYKTIGIFCIVFVIFLICFVTLNIIWNKKPKIYTEEWVNISDFPTTLEIDKEWKLLSYPEVIVLAESDWSIMNLNVSQWDIVQERDILMQIWEEDWIDENTDIDTRIWRKFAEYYQVKNEYEEFESEFWEEISVLEKNLGEYSVEFAVNKKVQQEICNSIALVCFYVYRVFYVIKSVKCQFLIVCHTYPQQRKTA